MTASRGDTKPCIYTGCSGTMQYARGEAQRPEERVGWMCSASRKHVQRPAETRSVGRKTAAARAGAGWDDDGGGGRPPA